MITIEFVTYHVDQEAILNALLDYHVNPLLPCPQTFDDTTRLYAMLRYCFNEFDQHYRQTRRIDGLLYEPQVTLHVEACPHDGRAARIHVTVIPAA